MKPVFEMILDNKKLCALMRCCTRTFFHLKLLHYLLNTILVPSVDVNEKPDPGNKTGTRGKSLTGVMN